jgi:FixJ family two-component response regulator
LSNARWDRAAGRLALVADARGTGKRDILSVTMHETSPHTASPIIYVVDDDAAVRASVVSLLESADYQVRPFACAREFLATKRPLDPACLILDMHMPKLGGLDVVAELARIEAGLPVIFLTGFGSIPLSVQAMKAGASEFLTKPVHPEQLLDAVRAAIDGDAAALALRRELAGLRERLASLTPRERETMELVIGGLLNKQVADAMGISEIMAKTHKRKVMEKMQARSLPDLVRDAERLQIVSSRHR